MTLRIVPSVLGKRTICEIYINTHRPTTRRLLPIQKCPINRQYASVSDGAPRSQSSRSSSSTSDSSSSSKATASSSSSTTSISKSSQAGLSRKSDRQFDWEDNPNLSISKFSELPDKDFGVNQHIVINEEFKEALRQILWKFRAPIRYAFAYGSGVFPQGGSSGGVSNLHPSAPEAITNVQGGKQKMIDFIFGVSYSQHWHSLNMQEHPKHYSAVRHLGSYAVSKVQDSIGAGVYFNPYITVNGTLIKYGVINLDTLCKDLSEWNTLYIAGRLQKPVKILRDNPSVRLANQVNLISAVRTALLLLPPEFTEMDLYSSIAGISYVGDPRMSIGEDPRKVSNIVTNQLPNFRRLYAPFIENLPNISFNDSQTNDPKWFEDPKINAKLSQNMDPVTRGHMVRRLPNAFREKLYFEYQSKFRIPGGQFKAMMQKIKDEDPERIRRREGGEFEQRIAGDEEGGGLREEVRQVIEKTVRWPSTTQSLKAIITAGFSRSWRYAKEKREKATAAAQKKAESETEKKVT